MTTGAGNLPRWRASPRFFEIWFLVIFVPEKKRAYWLRYSLFAPALGKPGTQRAILWAAAFDAQSTTPAIGIKSIRDIDAYAPRTDGSFGVHIGDAELSAGVCRGQVSEKGHTISWDLQFDPETSIKSRTPWLMNHYLPLPTRVIHAYEGLRMNGCITVDDATIELRDAPALQKHLWGTRRVEELYWIYCPHFADDPAARLEATSVRPTQMLIGNVPFPALAPIWVETSKGNLDFFSAWNAVRNEFRVAGPGKLHVRATSLVSGVEIRAHCDPRSLVGYVYRDPEGQDLYIAQSDIASCEVDLLQRSNPFGSFRKTHTLTAQHTAAIEFHLPQPLDGVRYIGWDETSLVDE